MKSIANQYRDLKEGRMSQANFMRNLRMSMPQYITNVTSFNDAVRILKSKNILTEAMDIQPVPEADEEFESDDAETQAMIDKIEKEMAGEEAVKAQYDITEAKQKIDADRVHPNELSMGIRVEMEHTKDAEKAKKIALDHLAENPFYYTQLKLSGVDVKATPSKEKKAIAKKKDETELVDKANQMKPVKGVEKAKASANKATKETNKPVKGISLMSLIAKTARGVQKMAATGEKMKVVREGQENYYQTNVRLKPEEQKKIKSVLLDAEFEWDEDDRKQVVYSKKSEKEIQNVVDNVTGMATPSSGPKQSGVAKFLTKEDLAEMVREVLAEMESDDEVTADVALGMDETFDGRDNLTDTAGHQLDENNNEKLAHDKRNTGFSPVDRDIPAERAKEKTMDDLDQDNITDPRLDKKTMLQMMPHWMGLELSYVLPDNYTDSDLKSAIEKYINHFGIEKKVADWHINLDKNFYEELKKRINSSMNFYKNPIPTYTNPHPNDIKYRLRQQQGGNK